MQSGIRESSIKNPLEDTSGLQSGQRLCQPKTSFVTTVALTAWEGSTRLFGIRAPCRPGLGAGAVRPHIWPWALCVIGPNVRRTGALWALHAWLRGIRGQDLRAICARTGPLRAHLGWLPPFGAPIRWTRLRIRTYRWAAGHGRHRPHGRRWRISRVGWTRYRSVARRRPITRSPVITAASPEPIPPYPDVRGGWRRITVRRCCINAH